MYENVLSHSYLQFRSPGSLKYEFWHTHFRIAANSSIRNEDWGPMGRM